MAKSESTREWVKQVGGEPVTWKGFAQTGLVIGSLVSGISCSVWSEDKAHEALQTAEIRVKADKEDLRDLVEEFRLLRGWLEGQMRLGKMEIRFGGEERVIGQSQSQEIKIQDMIGAAAQQDFDARWQVHMKQYPPCVTGEINGLQPATSAVAGQSNAVVDGDGSTGSGAIESGGSRDRRADVHGTSRQP